MESGAVISYFRSCYQADNRGLSIFNFFGGKVERRLVMDGQEDLLTGMFPHVPVDSEAAAEIQKVLALYSREKELVYCSLFFIGQTRSAQGRAQRVCAPLFLFPAELVQDEPYHFLNVDLSARRLNTSFLASIRGDETTTELEEALLGELDSETVGVREALQLADTLSEAITGLDTTAMLHYPELWDERKLKRYLQPKALASQSGYRLVPAAGVGLIKRSTDTLGVLTELAHMAESGTHSAPLQALLGSGPGTGSRRSPKQGRVPAILNQAQQGILRAATQFDTTLVVGPPGTGKSYTVASLAVEHLSRGESVLIASRTDQAVDVIAEKIESQLGLANVVVRAGRKEYLRGLKQHLKNLLGGINPYEAQDRNELRRIDRRLDRLERDIGRLERDFTKRVEAEMDWGEFLANGGGRRSFMSGLREKYIHWRNAQQDPHWTLLRELEDGLAEWLQTTAALIQRRYAHRVHTALDRHRSDLALFLKAISARTGRTQERYFQDIDFRAILKTFPIWLVKMSDIYKVLPLRSQLFDIAIIDEATQCDMATCLPVIQRARRAVFAGDPNQLRHVSFLSRSTQARLQEQCGLDGEGEDWLNYRERSVLDLVTDRVTDQSQVVFLNEHYRSTPQIIRFSNETFYSDALRIMTDRPNIPANEGIEVIECDGVRDKSGRNAVEADQIVDRVRRIIDAQRGLDKTTCQTIGILSPFRDQAEHITSLISKQCCVSDMEKHRLAVGTAYAFQGEERDVMFLSFAVDNQSHPSAMRHLNRADVFNVSVTRARSLQYLYTSIDYRNLEANSLLRCYLEGFRPVAHGAPAETDSVRDRFCTEVEQELRKRGLQLWVGYPVAGLEIDLIVHHGDRTFGIDLIGYPGQFRDAFSLERYKMLKRAGLRTFPLPYTYWLADRERCVAEVMAMVGA